MPEIFVFGSNTAGRHGKGAALFAYKNHGAIYYQGEGRQGNSYAIPTKGIYLQRLSLGIIQGYINRFIEYAKAHSELRFKVTPIGTGLAGYTHEEIAPMFRNSPENCIMPVEWKDLI